MSRVSPRRVSALAACVLGTALGPAYADSGTALVWFEIGHLLIGNLLIGMGEALVVWLLLRRRASLWRLMSVLVVANYAAWIGGACVLPRLRDALAPRLLGPSPLADLPRLMWLLYLGAFALTVLVETPVLAACRRWVSGAQAPRTAALLAAFTVANVLSYGVLAAYYRSVSELSALTEFAQEPEPGFARARDARVFYSRHGGERTLMEVGLDGSEPRHSRLTAYELAEATRRHKPDGGTGRRRGDLRGRAAQRWVDVFPGLGGLSARAADGTRFPIGLHAPLFTWGSQVTFLLPGDQVVANLGPYIVLIDLNTRQMATLARGDLVHAVFLSAPSSADEPDTPSADAARHPTPTTPGAS